MVPFRGVILEGNSATFGYQSEKTTTESGFGELRFNEKFDYETSDVL
jgi:hypothetical protein